MTTLATNAAALRLILTAAEARGLPEPTDFAASRLPGVRLQFRTPAHLERWADWMEVETRNWGGPGGIARWEAVGELLDHPVRLTCYLIEETVA